MKTYEKPYMEIIELCEMDSVMLGLSGTKADNSEVFANPFRGFGSSPFAMGSPFGNPFANPFAGPESRLP